MKESRIRSFRERLLAMRRAKLVQHGSPDADEAPASLTGDAADAAAFNDDREQALNLRGEEKRSFEEIEAALARIAAGEFGICEECGLEILEKRLQAMPQARLCLPCQELREREQLR